MTSPSTTKREYFRDFHDAVAPLDLEEPLAKPPDVGADVLPFDHLGDRRFEILAYRLKFTEFGTCGHRVTLMQGVGERGRDVIIHSDTGKLTQVVQCKNYRTRLDATSVRKELLKLALHHHLTPDIIGDGPVAYELWCPGGLSEPASSFLDRWPAGWNATQLAEVATEVIDAYKAFEGLDWSSIGPEVLARFAARVRPSHVDGVRITAGTRGCLPIYEAFFQGNVVMRREDAIAAVGENGQQVLEEVREVKRILASGFAKLTDADARHIVDRIASFTPTKRFAHLSGYVMGLPAELVSNFKRKEFEEFAKHATNATAGMIQTVTTACARIASEYAREFREAVQPTNTSISHIFAQTLTLSMIHRVAGMLMQTRKLQPELEAYGVLPLRARFEHHARALWESYQRCLAGYDPKQHPVASDEEFRARIAVHGMQGAVSQATFTQNALKSADDHMPELRRRFDTYMQLVPEEILVVTDTVTALEHQGLADRMAETMQLLKQLRGTSIIPE